MLSFIGYKILVLLGILVVVVKFLCKLYNYLITALFIHKFLRKALFVVTTCDFFSITAKGEICLQANRGGSSILTQWRSKGLGGPRGTDPPPP